jgi:hypothetical protein
MSQTPPATRGTEALAFAAAASLYLLAVYSSVLQANYGFADDYVFLFHGARNEFGPNPMWDGRPLYTLWNRATFTLAGDIAGLRWLRVVSLVGILGFAIAMFRTLREVGWSRVEAATLSCLISSGLPFGVYAAWAATSQVPWACLVAFLGGRAAWNAGADPRSLRVVPALVAALAVVVALCLHQSAAPAFWLSVGFLALAARDARPDLLRRAGPALGCFTAACLVYFAGFQLAHRVLRPKILPRSSLVFDPLEKLSWFVQEPLRYVASLGSVLHGGALEVVVIAGVASTIAWGILARGRRLGQPVTTAFVALALLPLAHLPHLFLSEEGTSFRTLGSLHAVVSFLFVLGLREVLHRLSLDGSRAAAVLLVSLALLAGDSTRSRVREGLVTPQVRELGLLRDHLTGHLGSAPAKLVFRRPSPGRGLSRYGLAEFGLVSTAWPWVPEPLISLLLRPPDGALPAIEVVQLSPEEPFKPEAGVPCVDMAGLLEDLRARRRR